MMDAFQKVKYTGFGAVAGSFTVYHFPQLRIVLLIINER